MVLSAGGKLGPFQIERELGRGGMGEVYLARDTRLDRRVAIKALAEHSADDPDRLARLQREAKILATLHHPAIGAIYGVEQGDGRQYLILEYVEGETLADRLARGALPVGDALVIARQIAEALEAAHEKGIIHRDLKPGNVMVTAEGAVKVLDFGLARAIDDARSGEVREFSPDSPTVTSPAPDHSPTIPGAIMGTAGYMSPEQARGKPVDKRSDIFSFGSVLFEMLAGAGPFPGETVTDSLGAIIQMEPDWSLLPSGTPYAVRVLVKRCLAKNRKERLHDIADARIELQGAIADPSALSPVARRPRRSREALAWSLAVLFAMGAGAAWFAGHHRAAQAPGAFRQLNIRPEEVFRAAFAPDGKTVIYSAASEGNTPEVFIVRPESPEPQPLGLRQTHLLSISSRGELAVLTGAEYLAHRLFTGTLARVPMGGGTPRPLLDGVREADWAPDGERLAIIRAVDGKDRLEFPIGNVLRKTAGYFSDLRFNRAGDRIAFFEHPIRYDDRGTVNVTDLSGRARLLSGVYWGAEGLAWSPDGSEVLYSASIGGEIDAVYAATEAGAHSIRTAYAGPGDSLIHDVNAAGRWLIAQETYRDGVMVRAPGFDRDREFCWLGNTGDGSLSQDGRMLVFTEFGAAMGPNYGACVRGTDGSPVLHLGEGGVEGLSRDGKWLLAMVPSTPPTLVAYPLGPGEPVRLEQRGLEGHRHVRWFRDSSRVLMTASEPGKRARTYVQDFPSGVPRPVTPEGTFDGLLSPDERSILAFGWGPAGGYAIFPIDGGEPRPVSGLTKADQVWHWCADGKSVLKTRGASIPRLVERVDLESGLTEPFMTLGPNDLSGVVLIARPFFTDDLKFYSYDCVRTTSKLFVTQAPR